MLLLAVPNPPSTASSYLFAPQAQHSLLMVADDLNIDENVDVPQVCHVERHLESRDRCVDGLPFAPEMIRLTCNTTTVSIFCLI